MEEAQKLQAENVKSYRSRVGCNGLVGTRLGRRDFGGSRLGWRELVGWRGHDGSRLRSTTQLQVVRRGSRIEPFMDWVIHVDRILVDLGGFG